MSCAIVTSELQTFLDTQVHDPIWIATVALMDKKLQPLTLFSWPEACHWHNIWPLGDTCSLQGGFHK